MTLSPEGSKIYTIKAIHVAERLKLKELRERFTHKAIEFSNYEMIVKYSDDSFLFVYNYGSVVFFNVPSELQEKELSSIQEYRASEDLGRASDVFILEVQDGLPKHAGGASNKVYFDRIVVSTLSYEVVKITCMLLAESTA